MSKAEIDRFSNDLKTSASLEAKVQAAGTGIPALLEVANAHGYAITLDDVRDYIRSQSQELTDEQIEAVVGGRGPIGSPIIRSLVIIVIYAA
jgi:predicted ribosomally synthesized peptide with nif11-like leader